MYCVVILGVSSQYWEIGFLGFSKILKNLFKNLEHTPFSTNLNREHTFLTL